MESSRIRSSLSDFVTPDQYCDYEPKRFVYRCASCEYTLRVSNKLDAPGDVIHSLHARCPSCSISLEGSVECKFETHQGGGVAEIPAPSKAVLRPVIFQRASSFMRFSLDFLPLDRLLLPLEPGNLVMLRGRATSFRARRR